MKEHWKYCLDLAVEALCVGSLGISAVVTNKKGEVISAGRNQLYDNQPSCNKLRGTIISHAELNAVAGIPEEYRDNRDVILYSTVESCPVCMGAIAMSRVRKVVFASSDSYAGSSNLNQMNPYMAKKNIEISFEKGDVEKLFTVLHFASLLIIEKLTGKEPAMQAFQKQSPEYYALAKKLSADKHFLKHIEDEESDKVMNIILGS